MAKLYATITSDRSSTSHTSSRSLFSTVETWKAIVTTALHEDGQCYVTITDKHGNNRQTLWEGNADETAEKST